MVNAQQYINHNFSKEQRSEIKRLDINGKNLEGELKLEGFINLEELDCSDNLLTRLDLNSCQTEKLIKLNISNNNFSAQELSFLNTFTSLQIILLRSNDKEKIQQGIFNRFHGSLEPLRNLTELKELDIGGTNIDSGLEYLPRSLQNFNYSDNEVPRVKVTKIQGKLEPYQQFYSEEVWVWQLINSSLLSYSTRKEGLKKKIEEIQEKIYEKRNNRNKYNNYNKYNIIEEEKLNILREGLFYVNLNENLPQVNQGIKVEQIAEENKQLKERIISLEKEVKEMKNHLTLENELISLIVPIHSLDLGVLKEEIRKVKSESLIYQLQVKKMELEELKNTIKTKLNEESIDLMEILLESQVESIRNSSSFASKQLERAKKSLSKKLTGEETENLLDKHKEVTRLEIQLENLQAKSLGYQAQIEQPPK